MDADMEYSPPYQPQQQQQVKGASQSTDPPSQATPYDQSSANAYYASGGYQYNPPQDYSQQYHPNYYYPQQQDYSNYYAYQQQQQPEPTSIYPPGVPIPPPSSDPSYATQPQSHYPYYPPQFNYADVPGTVSVSHTPAIVQPPQRGRGKRGGKSGRGGGRGLPGYAEGQQKLIQGASQIQPGGPSQVKPAGKPPRTAWCELCKIECNTPEVLEVHKNGKKHKKNLKNSGQLQKLNKSAQASISEFKPAVSNPPGVEQLSQVHLPSQNVTGDGQLQPQENVPSQAVTEEGGSITGKQKVEEAAPAEELAQGRGHKRMARGGRGGKLMKLNNGSRKPAVPPPKPPKMVPLICELCNVTCESVVVFQSHLAGKKHLSNLKDFQNQQAMVGQAALQALYPALQALYPALQALCPPNNGASTSMGQPNLPELLGILAQQALSTIPQDQLLAIGAAATSALPPPSGLLVQDHQSALPPPSGLLVQDHQSALPPPSGLLVQDHQGSKFQGALSEETRENAAAVSADEPLRFATTGDVSSTTETVNAAISVSNTEVGPSDCTADTGLDGK